MSAQISPFQPGRRYSVRVTVEILRVYDDAPARCRARSIAETPEPTVAAVGQAAEKALKGALQGFNAAKEANYERLRRIKKDRRQGAA